MVDLDILFVLPSKPKLKKKNEILRVKVVETYKKKIVVGEEKGKATEQESSFMDSMQKVKEWNWDQPDQQREEYFFRQDGRENVEKQCQRNMWQPVGEVVIFSFQTSRIL